MTVREFIDHIKSSEIGTLFVSIDEDGDTVLANERVIVQYLNLGLIEINKIAKINRDIIKVPIDLSTEKYVLPDDVQEIILVIHPMYGSLEINNMQQLDLSIRQIKTREVMIPMFFRERPCTLNFEVLISFNKLTTDDVNAIIPISDNYTNSLFNYVAYKATTAQSVKPESESNIFLSRFLSSLEQDMILGNEGFSLNGRSTLWSKCFI
jgi:hypothetical protein